jgi:hypothetical protein
VAILGELFPLRPRGQVSYDERRNKKISSQSFIRYFTLKIPETELSDKLIEAEISKWKQDLSPEKIEDSLFTFQRSGKLLELVIKLNRDYSSDLPKNVVVALVKAIYLMADKLSRIGTEDLWNSEYDKALGLSFKLINEHIEKTEIQSLVEEIVEKTSDLAFATHAILFCTQERGGSLFNIYDSVDLVKLRSIVIRRLKKYFVDDKNNIFKLEPAKDWVFVLYQWGSNFMTFSGENNLLVNKYVLKLLKNDAKTFYEFINMQRRGGFRDDWKMDLTDFEKLYDTKKFVKLAKKFLKSSELNEDQKKILSLFINSASGQSIKKLN